MLDVLLKLLVNLSGISLITLHSLTPTLPSQAPLPSPSKALEKESFEMFIEETFIPLSCRFIVNYFTEKELEKMLKASGCDQYYEIRKTLKLIPVFTNSRKGGEQ